jgi:serine/threonine-protein kinase HipA
MTDNQLHLLMGDAVAGTVTRLPTGRLAYKYDSAYAQARSSTPVSVSMPPQVASHPDGKITPWLWGLLPDNDAVLSRWSREFHVSATPFSLLATPLGEDCPGAVRLVPEDRGSEVINPGSHPQIEWLTEGDVAQRLRDLRKDQTAWLGTKDQGRFSLAGAQAKTALLRDGDRWGDPHGAIATTHILKPAIEGFDEHDLNEHLCLSAMRAAGMLAVRTTVERFGDHSAIVVARYDRRLEGDRQIRVHQEDMCQALGIHPARKYQNEGGPGPGDIAALFRRVMPLQRARAATLAFLDALVWNWIIAGTDAHAKNYSLLLLENQVALAPFYDVASSLPYGWAEQKTRLAMKFGSDYRINPVSRPWKHLAKNLHVPESEVIDRAYRLIAVAPKAFESAATDPALRSLDTSLPDRLAELVSQRARKCAGYLE